MALSSEEKSDLQNFANSIAGMVEDLHKRVENIEKVADLVFNELTRKKFPRMDIPKERRH